MPTFLDHHPMGPVSPELRESMTARIQAGERDEHGVQGLSVMLAENGEAYCLSDAPDAESVVKAHQALGIAVSRDHVVQVQTVP
jgi:hypothetical protein